MRQMWEEPGWQRGYLGIFPTRGVDTLSMLRPAINRECKVEVSLFLIANRIKAFKLALALPTPRKWQGQELLGRSTVQVTSLR